MTFKLIHQNILDIGRTLYYIRGIKAAKNIAYGENGTIHKEH